MERGPVSWDIKYSCYPRRGQCHYPYFLMFLQALAKLEYAHPIENLWAILSLFDVQILSGGGAGVPLSDFFAGVRLFPTTARTLSSGLRSIALNLEHEQGLIRPSWHYLSKNTDPLGNTDPFENFTSLGDALEAATGLANLQLRFSSPHRLHVEGSEPFSHEHLYNLVSSRNWPTLRTLCLRGTKIDCKSFLAMLHTHNTSLKQLSLTTISFTEDIYPQIRDICIKIREAIGLKESA